MSWISILDTAPVHLIGEAYTALPMDWTDERIITFNRQRLRHYLTKTPRSINKRQERTSIETYNTSDLAFGQPTNSKLDKCQEYSLFYVQSRLRNPAPNYHREILHRSLPL